jgi:hypothetical protein
MPRGSGAQVPARSAGPTQNQNKKRDRPHPTPPPRQPLPPFPLLLLAPQGWAERISNFLGFASANSAGPRRCIPGVLWGAPAPRIPLGGSGMSSAGFPASRGKTSPSPPGESKGAGAPAENPRSASLGNFLSWDAFQPDWAGPAISLRAHTAFVGRPPAFRSHDGC